MSTVSLENWKVLRALISKFKSSSESPRRLVLTGLLGPNPRVSDSWRPEPAESVSGMASTKVSCSSSKDQDFIFSPKEVYSPGNTWSSAIYSPKAAHVAHSDTWLRSDYLPGLCHQSENKLQPSAHSSAYISSLSHTLPPDPAPSLPVTDSHTALSHHVLIPNSGAWSSALLVCGQFFPQLFVCGDHSQPLDLMSDAFSDWIKRPFPKVWAVWDFLHAFSSYGSIWLFPFTVYSLCLHLHEGKLHKHRNLFCALPHEAPFPLANQCHTVGAQGDLLDPWMTKSS